MVTHASRNIGLRQQRSGRPGDPIPPAAFGNAPSAPQFPLPAPNPFGDDTVAVPPAALGNAPGGGAPPPVDQRRGAEITVPLAPWDNAMPGPNSGPGGIGGDFRFPTQQVDERLLPAPAVAAPLPPARPGALGTVLANAVVPTPPPRPAAAPAAPQTANGFTMITAPNSDPNARFRPQISALDLSRLFGGR